MKSFESIAEQAFLAFLSAIPEEHSRLMYSSFAELPPEAQAGWLAAARKVAEEIQQVH